MAKKQIKRNKNIDIRFLSLGYQLFLDLVLMVLVFLLISLVMIFVPVKYQTDMYANIVLLVCILAVVIPTYFIYPRYNNGMLPAQKKYGYNKVNANTKYSDLKLLTEPMFLLYMFIALAVVIHVMMNGFLTKGIYVSELNLLKLSFKSVTTWWLILTVADTLYAASNDGTQSFLDKTLGFRIVNNK